MKIPSITFVFDRKHTATRTKEAAVELRVTLDRKRVYMSTGVRLCKGQWKNGEVVGRMDCAVLNRLLAGVRLRALGAVEALARGGTLDIRSIPAMLRSRASSMTFPQYVGKRASERSVRASTRERYLCFKRFLESWRGIVTFSDVSVSSVRAMNECLARRGLKDSTIRSYNKYMHLFICDAVADGLLPSNPYDTGKIRVPRRSEGQIECLSAEQVDRLRGLDLGEGFLSRTRDVFLFQCLTGLSYSDVRAFDMSVFTRNTYGMLCAEGRRVKTGSPYYLCLLPEAEAIAARYGGRLPVPSNQKYNAYLKVLGAGIGCPRLHSHMGRSTFATMMLNKGVPVDVLRHMVGHRDRSQTERYATMREQTIGRFFKEVSSSE